MKTYKITDGPRKKVLISGFSGAYDNELVVFKIENNDKSIRGNCSVQICELSHESGSGHSFNFNGFAKLLDVADLNHLKYKGYYNAKTKKGNITFINE
jgi:hypothetical protein